jgi:methyl acetate hydrolase
MLDRDDPYNDDLPKVTADCAAAIDRMFDAAVERGALPGIVAAITNKHRTLYLKAFGRKDVSEGTPMAEDTIFRIASMTKPVTSVAILRLCEAGKLRLDDPACEYEPSLRGRAVIAGFHDDCTYALRPATRDLTIRHLLTHTSGLAYEFTSYDPAVIEVLRQFEGLIYDQEAPGT